MATQSEVAGTRARDPGPRPGNRPGGSGERAAEIAYRHTHQLAREYEITDPPLVHNTKVNMGLKPRGLCWHWAEDMGEPARGRGVRDTRNPPRHRQCGQSFRIDHSTAIVSRRGDAFDEGIVIDPVAQGRRAVLVAAHGRHRLRLGRAIGRPRHEARRVSPKGPPRGRPVTTRVGQPPAMAEGPGAGRKTPGRGTAMPRNTAGRRPERAAEDEGARTGPPRHLDGTSARNERPARQKRSLTLRGHRTSVSLEDAFWKAFREIAAREGRAINDLAAEIDAGARGRHRSRLRDPASCARRSQAPRRGVKASLMPSREAGGKLGDGHRDVAAGDAVAGDDCGEADDAFCEREGGAGADARTRRERR